MENLVERNYDDGTGQYTGDYGFYEYSCAQEIVIEKIDAENDQDYQSYKVEHEIKKNGRALITDIFEYKFDDVIIRDDLQDFKIFFP